MKHIMPSVGTAVEVVINRGAAVGDAGEHVLAEVADETPGGLILSSFDAPDGFALPNVNAPLHIRFHTQDSGYEFNTILLQKKEAPFKIAYVAKPTEILRRQLRAYLRVPCLIPAGVIRRDDKKRIVMPGTILNISGGGCLVSLATSVPQEVMLELKFELSGGPAISAVSARIVQIRKGDDDARIHVLQFEGIDEEQRTSIIRYTFKQQRAAARDGLDG